MTANRATLNVGLIGFGLSGRYFHASFLKVNPHFNLTKVVSRNKDFIKSFDPAIEVVSTTEELLQDDTIDIVFVCTPNQLHFENAMAALSAGKHVVIEKPFANTLAEAQQIVELATKNNLIATAYQNRRWDADFLTIQKLIQEGKLGDVVEYEAHFDRYRPEVALNTWKEQLAAGAGNLYNLGPHLIDQALTLFGTPQSVTATIKTIRPGAEIDDYFDIRLNYADKTIILKSSLMVYENSLRYIVHGTKGSFFKMGLDVQEENLRKDLFPNTPTWGQEPEQNWGVLYNTEGRQVVASEAGNYMPFYQNLYDAIVKRKPLHVQPSQALNTTRVIERALESSKLQKTVDF